MTRSKPMSSSLLRCILLLLFVLLLLLFCTPTNAAAQEEQQEEAECDANGVCTITDVSCEDGHEKCAEWAQLGECDANPNYMLSNCRKSCDACQARTLIQSKWGVPQDVSGDRAAEVQAVVDKTTTYMLEEVLVKDSYAKVRSECKNRNELCAFWAVIGECEANPSYMVIQCAPSCQSCDQIDFSNRCPFDKDAPTALNAGDLDRMFEHMVSNPEFQPYEPQVHSQPKPTSKDIQSGPWVVTFNKFLTAEECQLLIDYGAKEGYERSSDVGKQKFDGTFDSFENDGRTSTNAWCTTECYENEKVQTILQRIELVTGIPEANFEYLQMLRYEVGQYYRQHHDYIHHQLERAEGVRTLTVFLYLNNVEEGGGTNFPKLSNLTMEPSMGKALIWPSVLNSDPNKKDARTDHQALPVLKGIKYGTNAWIHQRDFKEPYKRSCH